MPESPTSKNAKEANTSHKTISDEGQVFFRLATLVIIIAVLYFARAIFVPFALAVLLTFVLVPVVMRVDRLRVKQW